MIPRHTKYAFDSYVIDGTPPGDFLRAVLTNDLCEAALRADGFNVCMLCEIATYSYHYLPNVCHGSEAKVQAWLEVHEYGMPEGDGPEHELRRERVLQAIEVYKRDTASL